MQHRGTAFYTVGQNARIGGAASKQFVVSKDLTNNTVSVVSSSSHPALYSNGVTCPHFMWLSGSPPADLLERKFEYQVRYHGQVGSCRFEELDGVKGSYVVRFAQPHKAVAPGQILVLYDGDLCLGGSMIGSTLQH